MSGSPESVYRAAALGGDEIHHVLSQDAAHVAPIAMIALIVLDSRCIEDQRRGEPTRHSFQWETLLFPEFDEPIKLDGFPYASIG